MKFRDGFVSNSSSSSYIVNIDGITLDKFIKIMYREYTWSLFNKGEVKKEVYAHYSSIIKEIRTTDPTTKEVLESLHNNWLGEAKVRKNKFNDIKSDEELVKFVFDIRGVLVSETETGVELVCDTTMHNSFADVPEIVREVIMYFLIDTGYNVSKYKLRIRVGFISNSSSSSFIVAWEKPVTSLADVTKFISDEIYAERIFQQISKQEGIVLCNVAKNKCEPCKDRFKCFTDRGSDLLSAMHEWLGYETVSSILGEVTEFGQENDGKIVYFLTFSNGDNVGARMRSEAHKILKKLSIIDI